MICSFITSFKSYLSRSFAIFASPCEVGHFKDASGAYLEALYLLGHEARAGPRHVELGPSWDDGSASLWSVFRKGEATEIGLGQALSGPLLGPETRPRTAVPCGVASLPLKCSRKRSSQ